MSIEGGSRLLMHIFMGFDFAGLSLFVDLSPPKATRYGLHCLRAMLPKPSTWKWYYTCLHKVFEKIRGEERVVQTFQTMGSPSRRPPNTSTQFSRTDDID